MKCNINHTHMHITNNKNKRRNIILNTCMLANIMVMAFILAQNNIVLGMYMKFNLRYIYDKLP